MSTKMTQLQLTAFFTQRGWRVENVKSITRATSNYYKGISIHAHCGKYTFSIQGGLGKYSDPPVEAHEYTSVEIAVFDNQPSNNKKSWVNLSDFTTVDDTLSSETIDGWVGFDRIIKITKEIETRVLAKTLLKRTPKWDIQG